MADPRVQQGAGDNGNGGNNEESRQVLPPVNDSKGKGKLKLQSDSAMATASSSSTELNSSELMKTEESSLMAEWDDPMAAELEQLLIPQIKDACQTAAKKIAEFGYSEEQATWAMLASGIYLGYMDITTNIVNGVFALIAYINDYGITMVPLFDGLESLAAYILLEMVSVLKELKPFLTVAEAMWLLLIYDLNIIHAVEDDVLRGSDTRSSQTSNVSGIPSDVPLGNYVPLSEKDEMIVSLMQRKQQLQNEVQGWTDWANVKVGQAAQKLRMIRKERQEAEEFQKGKAVLKESNIKKHSELENALFNSGVQLEEINSAHCRLEAENTVLMKELSELKLISENSSKNVKEAKVREQELQKQCRTLELGMSSLQGELAGLKRTSDNLQVEIEKARRRQSEFEALRQHEEREKTKLLQKAETLRRERLQMMDQAKAEEENLRAVAEENRQKFEEQKKKLTAEISALKMAAVGESSSQGGVKRNWECVMCLTEAKIVVFLPCAHQVLCKDCNLLHESQGMKDCPLCRTPITKRIHARFAPPQNTLK